MKPSFPGHGFAFLLAFFRVPIFVEGIEICEWAFFVTFPTYDPMLPPCMLVFCETVLQVFLQVSLRYLSVFKNEHFVQFALDLADYNVPSKRMVVVVF
jgi:hypothetical protein